MAEAKKKSELVTASVLLAFSMAYTLSSLRLRIGKISNPGPGLMPLLLGIALAACALVYLIRELQSRPVGAESSGTDGSGLWTAHRVPLFIVAAVVAYPFLLAWLGFLAATTLVVSAVMLLLRFKTPAWSIGIGIVMSVLCYLLFARALGVVLPSGPLENFLFKWL